MVCEKTRYFVYFQKIISKNWWIILSATFVMLHDCHNGYLVRYIGYLVCYIGNLVCYIGNLVCYIGNLVCYNGNLFCYIDYHVCYIGYLVCYLGYLVCYIDYLACYIVCSCLWKNTNLFWRPCSCRFHSIYRATQTKWAIYNNLFSM